MRKSLYRLALLAAMLPRMAVAQVALSGRILDENNVAVQGAALTLRPQAPAHEAFARHIRSDPTGAFAFLIPKPDQYFLRAEHKGFFLLENLPVELKEGENKITVVLNHLREVYESVDVAYSPPAIDFEQTAAEQAVTGNDILFVLYPSSHSLRNAMRIMPGAVVQDNIGEIHFNGGAADQTYWTLDGFNITDPLTGRFASQLSVEAARSVALSSGRYSAEFGKGSAGALAIETDMGADQFRFSASNFVPGIENRKGLTLGDWRPRANVSGPIVRGRAWFSNSADVRYSKHIVEELPEGGDRTSSLGFSNMFRTQVNLTPANILYTGLLANVFNAPRSGLTVLDPHETTVDRRSRQYFFHLKDQHYFQQGLMLELGYARNRTFGREIPQGHEIYVLTPNGRQGNFFIDAQRWGQRDQWLTNAILPAFDLAGSHQLKIGSDANWLEYRQDVRRTGFERRRLDGTLRRRVTFGGDGNFRRRNTEFAWYLQDTWKARPNLLLEIGVRQDRDSIVGDLTTSPRFAFSWAPSGSRHTKISGGYAVVYDATKLQTFTRNLDQHTLATAFDQQGNLDRGPLVTLFTIDGSDFKAPRYHNWSIGLEQSFPGDFYARTNYLRRRGRDGFTFVNTFEELTADLLTQAAALGGTGFEALYGFRNARRDEFDSFEVTVRKTFRKQYVWLGSYTRSRSISNAAFDISIDNPALISENFGPTSWDAPHRFLSWGYFPLTKKWAVGYMVEGRSGFPFSVEDDEGRIVGLVNSWRFPNFLELNVHLERRFSVFGHRWALRGGVNNLTDHRNATVVRNNISSPDFLQFFGGTARAFVTRIRWLGKG